MRRVSITNLGAAAARDRADVLRRDRAGPARRRRRPPGLLQPLRRDRVRSPSSAPCWPPAAPRAPRRSRAVWAAHTRRRSRAQAGGGAQYETDRGPLPRPRAASVRTPMSVDRRPARCRTPPGSVLDPIFSLRRRIRLAPGRAAPALIFSTARRPVARGRGRARRQVPRPGDVRAHRRPWPGPRRRSSSTTSASTRTRPTSSSVWPAAILFSDPALRAVGRTCCSGTRSGPSALWAPRHLRRPADRAGPDRRARGPRHRPPAAPGPRVLAREGPRGRPGHPEREGATPTRRSSRPRWRRCVRTSQSAPRHERQDGRGQRLHPPRRICSAGRRTPLLAGRRRGSCSCEPTRHARRAARVDAEPRVRTPAAPPRGARRRPRSARRTSPLAAPGVSSSSTASAASPTTGASTSPSSARDSGRPAPWVNVVANPASASRSPSRAPATPGRVNSRENQLTPWSNDPVSDPPGEAIYLRDEETGELWSPTVAPDPRGGLGLHRPPRPGLQPLRAHARTASRSSLAPVRAARGPDQDLAPDASRTAPAARAACR